METKQVSRKTEELFYIPRERSSPRGILSFSLESIHAIRNSARNFKAAHHPATSAAGYIRQYSISISDSDGSGGSGGGRRIDQKIADATTPIRARPRAGR